MTVLLLLLFAFTVGFCLRMRVSIWFSLLFVVTWVLFFLFGNMEAALQSVLPFVYPKTALAVFSALAFGGGWLVGSLLVERVGAAIAVGVVVVTVAVVFVFR